MRRRMRLIALVDEEAAQQRAASENPNTPWICSGPPHLLGPWGRPVGRGEWPPRTATLRPATFPKHAEMKKAPVGALFS